MMSPGRPLHIKNALIWDDEQTIQRDLYTANGRIVDQPANGAQVVDLDGFTLFPGLINAHDHLELNHYPRSKFREVYDNAHQWGEDMNSRLDSEPYKSLRAYPLWDKVFIGGLKNLLCGVTTVVHHGPPHKPMFRADFPVRVLKQYSWAHSLHFDTDEEVVRSYRSTPKDWPWFIHLAEGTDEIAAGEYQRLKALGCVGENTVIVHGVGMSSKDIADAAQIIRGLVWCPTTNHYLLGKTASVRDWIGEGVDVALGNDSRLTADGDFGAEITNGLHKNAVDTNIIDEAIKSRSAKIIGLPELDQLNAGSPADILVNIRRKRGSNQLIIRDGLPRIGAPDIMAKFPRVQTVAATLDGVEKRIHIDLARQIHRCQLKEPGLEVDALPQKRFYLF
ncbi:MAG: amidohydrolase family protein [Anaerolineae bacterium]|nr:amidohydrolase family protein [Anaerolineae bacterium]